VRIAVDMVDEGLLDIEAAIDRVPLAALEELRAPVLHNSERLVVAGTGVPASPGSAIGRTVFDAHRAEELADEWGDVILVRTETSPEDIAGMITARAIVTAVGGRASHAAVVARGIGRPAVCGLDGLCIDEHGRTAMLPSGVTLNEGDVITVDGTAGVVLLGAGDLERPPAGKHLERLLGWCDARARVPVLGACPDGCERMTTGDETSTAGCVLVDVPWEGADSLALLAKVSARVAELGQASEMLLALPKSLRGADLRLPARPWTGIVAGPDMIWVARLLSARIALIDPAAPPTCGATTPVTSGP
jgi:pyruvate, orthophosphate dikinase